MKNLSIIIAIIFVTLFASCKKEDIRPSDGPYIYVNYSDTVVFNTMYAYTDGYVYSDPHNKQTCTQYKVVEPYASALAKHNFTNKLIVINPEFDHSQPISKDNVEFFNYYRTFNYYRYTFDNKTGPIILSYVYAGSMYDKYNTTKYLINTFDQRQIETGFLPDSMIVSNQNRSYTYYKQ